MIQVGDLRGNQPRKPTTNTRHDKSVHITLEKI